MTSQLTEDGGDTFLRFLEKHAEKLRAQGYRETQARGLAELEWRVANWPSDWPDYVLMILFGDFMPPKEALSFPSLGITIDSENVADKTLVKTARTALKARVSVKEKTVSALLDATARINLLLGIWAALGWGNWGSGWWSHITHGIPIGMSAHVPVERSEGVFDALMKLSAEIRQKVTSALYWIREPRQFSQENYRSDILRRYAGYWNAFECLVEAVCLEKPMTKMSATEKQIAIDQFVSGRRVDAALVADCYLTIVRPGFVGKASHALKSCFDGRAKHYIEQCFRIKPDADRLYQIRNDIDHGSIDADNLSELLRISERQRLLWEIVFIMLGRFIPTDRPPCSLG
jgi:hypothetical protein